MTAEQCTHEFRPIDSSGQLACIHCNARYRQAVVPSNERIADRIVEMIVHDLMNHEELVGQIWDEVPRRIRTAIETLWRHNTYAMLPSPAVETTAGPALCARCSGHQTSTDAGNKPCEECGGTGLAQKTAPALRAFAFDRYRNGKLMAEGIVVHTATEAEAWEKAKSMRRLNTDHLELRPAVSETP